MKTLEELNALKEELAAFRSKVAELTDKEMAEVAGGMTEEEYLKYIKRYGRSNCAKFRDVNS